MSEDQAKLSPDEAQITAISSPAIRQCLPSQCYSLFDVGFYDELIQRTFGRHEGKLSPALHRPLRQIAVLANPGLTFGLVIHLNESHATLYGKSDKPIYGQS